MTDSKKNKRIKPLRPKGVSESCLPPSFPCELDDASVKIVEELVPLARAKGITTYGKIGLKVNMEPNSDDLSVRLGGISWITYDEAEVFLSVLVTREDDGFPGQPGFYNLVKELSKEPCPTSNEAIFVKELNRVYEAAESGKLDFILSFND